MIDVSMKTTEDSIRMISEHYSKEKQTMKACEECRELLAELNAGERINGKLVLPDNTWSECADVIIMIAQLAMQHGKEEKVLEQIRYKVDRQINRIEGEKK